jgi:hypothetical protein
MQSTSQNDAITYKAGTYYSSSGTYTISDPYVQYTDISDISIPAYYTSYTDMGDSTYTITDDSLTVTTSVDQTPDDDVEKAELILRGICPACRRDDGKHEFTCPHYDYAVDGITINTKTTGAGMITVGNHTITEEKLEVLDRIIDAVGDDLDEFLDIIKDTIKDKKG